MNELSRLLRIYFRANAEYKGAANAAKAAQGVADAALENVNRAWGEYARLRGPMSCADMIDLKDEI